MPSLASVLIAVLEGAAVTMTVRLAGSNQLRSACAVNYPCS